MAKVRDMDLMVLKDALENLTIYINGLDDDSSGYTLNILGDIMYWSQEITQRANAMSTDIESGSYEASTRKSFNSMIKSQRTKNRRD